MKRIGVNLGLLFCIAANTVADVDITARNPRPFGYVVGDTLAFFDNQPYAGSRIVLLVSDGGARIDAVTREKLANLMKRNRAGLYWIYLRSVNSPSLFGAPDDGLGGIDGSPEIEWHEFIESIKTPYHAYDAENSSALQLANQDINRLEI